VAGVSGAARLDAAGRGPRLDWTGRRMRVRNDPSSRRHGLAQPGCPPGQGPAAAGSRVLAVPGVNHREERPKAGVWLAR